MDKNNNEIKQEDLDRSLKILTDTIKGLSRNLNVYSGDTANDLFNKMSDARNNVDLIADEARKIFQECLKRCLNSNIKIPEPSVKWEKDEYGNILENCLSRNKPPCEICGEIRKSQFCHIIPRQLGGSNKETNIIWLCPTHHSCFDKGVLSKEEWNTIDWRGRSEIVRSFVSEVFLLRQQDYWKGQKVYVDMVYYSYEPLKKWVKKYLGYDSISEWNIKRKNRSFMRNGKSLLG